MRRPDGPQGFMRSIAIIGASNDPSKFGNRAVRAFLAKGWRVYPVNPREKTIEGLPAYPGIAEVPERPELVSLYVPPAVGLALLPAVKARGCDELWLNPGADSPEVVEAAEALGLNVIQACSLVGHGMDPGDH